MQRGHFIEIASTWVSPIVQKELYNADVATNHIDFSCDPRISHDGLCLQIDGFIIDNLKTVIPSDDEAWLDEHGEKIAKTLPLIYQPTCETTLRALAMALVAGQWTTKKIPPEELLIDAMAERARAGIKKLVATSGETPNLLQKENEKI